MIDFTKPFEIGGTAPGTRSSVEDDSPPGAPPYASGPLAVNPPGPAPTPQPQSLATLAAGGSNHAEAWMAGEPSPAQLPQQAPFNSNNGMFAKQDNTPDMHDFTFSSVYNRPSSANQPGGY